MQHEKTTQWAGGTTRQIYIQPEASSLAERNFDLRISSATINLTQSQFSDFKGYTRYIMPLEGEITLSIRGKEIRLEKNRLFRFDGAEQVTSRNTPGAIDFNIIIASHKTADIRIETTAQAEAGTIIFALEDIQAGTEPLPRHTAIQAPAAMNVTGRAVLVKIK